MRPADSWKDYELLDATGGNRLERWGETILIRPDPQVVWKTPKLSPLWAKADAVYHRSNQGGGEWEYKRRLPEKWKISCGEGEDKLTLIVSPTGFKHTGVFPEQAVNWAWYARKIRAAGRPVKVLNLFGYTGGATLACAAAGATVCHVDASKGIVAWGKDNAVASGLADRPIRWLVDDCMKFVEREIRRGNHIDTTTKLRQVIEKTLDFLPEKEKKETIKKTCQRTFQALRIDVNHEFEVLYEFMEKLPDALRPGGRVAILTFHSGEDKLVKKALKAGYKEGIYSDYAKDVIRPSAKECTQNPRARSTKMRWAIKAE